jgi:hypothetical protein
MIAQFGIWTALTFTPAPALPEPAVLPETAIETSQPVTITEYREVIVVTDEVGGHFASADVTDEQAVHVQTREDAVSCSYVSDGAPGTGEAGQTYTLETGAAEAAALGLTCQALYPQPS